jgi:hypothetical protein
VTPLVQVASLLGPRVVEALDEQLGPARAELVRLLAAACRPLPAVARELEGDVAWVGVEADALLSDFDASVGAVKLKAAALSTRLLDQARAERRAADEREELEPEVAP